MVNNICEYCKKPYVINESRAKDAARFCEEICEVMNEIEDEFND
ncbi:hypothetical protein AAGS61_01710 [Lysinibacillus sp. KU-BSD001]